MKIGYYPGSFDPITFGHVDIMTRGAQLFDKLYVSVSVNKNKNTLFTTEERVELVKKVTKEFSNIEVVQSEMGRLPFNFFETWHKEVTVIKDETTNKVENKPKTLSFTFFIY
jgi:pantetheine-phosphate adenylyltransferase